MHALGGIFFSVVLAGLLISCGGGGGGGGGQPAPTPTGVGPADCVAGTADGFDCRNINLDKRLPLSTLDANRGNDIWGWTDPADGTEYVLMGLDNGTAFVEIADPKNPVFIGKLPTQTFASTWRDIKVYADHAFIVADGAGAHGMQVFDLARLRTGGTGQTFAADIVYGDFTQAHNLAINEATGFAYAVGTNTCGGGLHMVDIGQPLNPMFAGCHVASYTHDAQCVAYTGPDPDHSGAEICFDSDEGSVGIVDVSMKSSPVTLATLTYPNLAFVHQAWLDESHRYLVVGDEFDELDFGARTSSIVIDVTDLDAPVYLYTHANTTRATDHNLFIMGNRVFQANYASGLRILEFTSLATDTLTEVAFFDTFPANDFPGTSGAWGVYPFFDSGTLVVSDTNRGLFILSET